MNPFDTTDNAVPNVRRALSVLRQRWKNHTPDTPFCLTDELIPGVTTSEFCEHFLIIQRMRRNGNRPQKEQES